MSGDRERAEAVHVPKPRAAEREVGIRDLRNAGAVIATLAEAGEIGRVTSGGRLVGWLVPVSAGDKRAEELAAAGRLRGGRTGGLSGRSPRAHRSGLAPLSRSLERQRDEDDR